MKSHDIKRGTPSVLRPVQLRPPGSNTGKTGHENSLLRLKRTRDNFLGRPHQIYCTHREIGNAYLETLPGQDCLDGSDAMDLGTDGPEIKEPCGIPSYLLHDATSPRVMTPVSRQSLLYSAEKQITDGSICKLDSSYIISEANTMELDCQVCAMRRACSFYFRPLILSGTESERCRDCHALDVHTENSSLGFILLVKTLCVLNILCQIRAACFCFPISWNQVGGPLFLLRTKFYKCKFFMNIRRNACSFWLKPVILFFIVASSHVHSVKSEERDQVDEFNQPTRELITSLNYLEPDVVHRESRTVEDNTRSSQSPKERLKLEDLYSYHIQDGTEPAYSDSRGFMPYSEDVIQVRSFQEANFLAQDVSSTRHSEGNSFQERKHNRNLQHQRQQHLQQKQRQQQVNNRADKENCIVKREIAARGKFQHSKGQNRLEQRDTISDDSNTGGTDNTNSFPMSYATFPVQEARELHDYEQSENTGDQYGLLELPQPFDFDDGVWSNLPTNSFSGIDQDASLLPWHPKSHSLDPRLQSANLNNIRTSPSRRERDSSSSSSSSYNLAEYLYKTTGNFDTTDAVENQNVSATARWDSGLPTAGQDSQGKPIIYIAGLFPWAEDIPAGAVGRGVLPAVHIALEHVNNDSRVHRKYILEMAYNDTRVSLSNLGHVFPFTAFFCLCSFFLLHNLFLCLLGQEIVQSALVVMKFHIIA